MSMSSPFAVPALPSEVAPSTPLDAWLDAEGLGHPEISTTCAKMSAHVGVTEPDDLLHVEESDLKDLLPIPRRKLLKAIQGKHSALCLPRYA